MVKITAHLSLQDDEVQFTFVRASGPGGQNVNKLATAAHMRFDVAHSPSLTDEVRERLTKLAGNRMTQQGELIIKASRYRTQERNKQDALTQLKSLIISATVRPKKRRKTKPTYGSVQQRLASKKLHGKKKAMRRGDGE